MYRIGELAEITNTSKRTIDYYTKIGLLECERSESNYRYYKQEAIADLKFIDQCKQTNMSLEQIKQRKVVLQATEINKEAMLAQTIDITNKMDFLTNEIEEIQSFFGKLDKSEQLKVVNNLKPHAMALMNALILLS
ncbi:MerR family transcriptional regulator [Aquibacillus salsiterrae]|uniref:MerR family transcriptional regulator n=1 Tax=Aquibacillus salsiterrae TaxID=2950439 RepID=A0A9X4AF94_9BACI|nr:MerR family transcriptional regulator [Aquibacillus salsiterrae]MDC3417626.1 MerR family transcriptional regulator [Aquibacillus salsiterrae]